MACHVDEGLAALSQAHTSFAEVRQASAFEGDEKQRIKILIAFGEGNDGFRVTTI